MSRGAAPGLPLLLLLLLLAGCSSAPIPSAAERFPGDHFPLKGVAQPSAGARAPLADPSPANNRPTVPSNREDSSVRIAGSSRPEVFGSHPVEYASLPLASVTTVPRAGAASFTMSQTGPNPEVRFSEKLVAQLEIGAFRGSSWTPLGKSVNGEANPCRRETHVGGKTATWEGIVRETWSASELDYVRHEGTFDGAGCKGVASRSVRVRAKAIIPSLLYAYRECVGDCNKAAAAGSVSGEEILVLIGPPSSWLTSNAPWPSEQLNPHVGILSRARVPISRGSSASVLMNANHWVVRNFVARFDGIADISEGNPRSQVLQLGFDAVWPSQDPSPDGVAFLGAVSFGTHALLESLGVPANPY